MSKIKTCPDCKEPLKHTISMNTAWHGKLEYFKCSTCKEQFVSQDEKELKIVR